MDCRAASKQRTQDTRDSCLGALGKTPTYGGSEGAYAKELAGELSSKLSIALVQGRAHLRMGGGDLLSVCTLLTGLRWVLKPQTAPEATAPQSVLVQTFAAGIDLSFQYHQLAQEPTLAAAPVSLPLILASTIAATASLTYCSA